MKNKNGLYIVLGIGAGVVAYYLFCKKKNSEGLTEVKSDEKSEKPVTSKAVAGGGGGGGIFSPVVPKSVTPIATTTPLVVNVTSTPSTPTPTATAVTPSKVDVGLVSTPVSTTTTSTIRPVSISETSVKPITTTATTTPTTTTATASTPLKSSFEGVGQQCFEVGECLNDL